MTIGVVAEFVVDASAVAKLFLDEPDAPRLRDWWYDALAAGANMLAPSLLRFEVGSLLRRNLAHLDAPRLRRAWRETLAGITIDDTGLESAFNAPALSFYDAAYVNLAALRQVPLVTFDDEMAEAAALQGIQVMDLRS